jgi:hypothetical protein
MPGVSKKDEHELTPAKRIMDELVIPLAIEQALEEMQRERKASN